MSDKTKTTVTVSKATLKKIQQLKYKLGLKSAEELILVGLKLVEERVKRINRR